MTSILPVSVLIPTMNRPNSLKNTLKSYLEADYIPAQIVVVDQSNDEFKNEVKSIVTGFDTSCNMNYIYQSTPSLTKARNNAVTHATEEIIICSDDDVEVRSYTVNAVNSLMQDETVALIAGMDDFFKQKLSKVGFVLGTRSFIRRNKGHITHSMLGRYPERVDSEINTEWAMGFFFAIRRSLLKKWNICWDEKLVSYGYPEDLDFSSRYCKRAAAEGLKCILHKDVYIKHMQSQEYRIPSAKNTAMYVINRYYLHYKNKGVKTSVAAMMWCDLWKTVERAVKRERPGDMLKAYKMYHKVKKQLKSGNLNPEFYDI